MSHNENSLEEMSEVAWLSRTKIRKCCHSRARAAAAGGKKKAGEKKERERRGRSTDADASDRRSKTGTMARISVLNDALRNMVNAERKGKRQVRKRNEAREAPEHRRGRRREHTRE